MPTEGGGTMEEIALPLVRSRVDQFLQSPSGSTSSGQTIRNSSGGRTPSNGGNSYEAQLVYQQHLAAGMLNQAAAQHHHRETSAFVPVLPSRGMRTSMYGGLLDSPDQNETSGKRGSNYELMAMMADKRKELALRDAAAAMLLPRSGVNSTQGPPGIYGPPGGYLSGPGPSPTATNSFVFPPGTASLFPPGVPGMHNSLDRRLLRAPGRAARPKKQVRIFFFFAKTSILFTVFDG